VTQELLSAAGNGIDLTPPPVLTVVPDLPEVYVGKRRKEYVEEVQAIAEGEPAAPPIVDPTDLVSVLREEMRVAVADIEWRLKQVYEQKLRMATGGAPVDMVTVEDINDGKHRLTGYTLTPNTPTGGITWASLHLVFKGVDYTIANGSTTNKYIWFVKADATAVTATTANIILRTATTMPTLGLEDALVFINNNGVPRSILEESVPSAVAPGSIDNAALAADVNLILTNLRSDLTNAQATADGAIQSYVQDTAPWANGSTQDPGKVGDVWYDSNDGGAFRWSGPGGSPVNTWVRIADTDVASLASKVGTKTTTYVSANASPPVAPAAQGGVPAGFAVGDFWMVTDQGNMFRRWSGSAWVDLQIGDAGISAVSGGKVGTGINASNVTIGTLSGSLVGTGISGSNITTGTVVAARVGAGVNGAVLTTASGQIGTTQLADSAVQPQKLNTAFHILY
jgi:hypothetical protein